MNLESDSTANTPGGFDLRRWRALEGASPAREPWQALPGHEVRRSSQGLPWPGLMLWHQVGPEGDLYVPPTAEHTILVRRAIPTDLLQRHGASVGRTRWRPGQAVVVPAGLPSFWRSARPRDNLHIDVAPSWLHRSAQAEVTLHSCFGRDDPVLDGFARMLLGALDSQAALHSGFGEHVAQALALHLLSHYAGPHRALRGGAWLLRRQMQQLEEAVREALDAHWTVERMARLVGLSSFHFARAFKASYGMTPHAWLNAQRMAHAAQLVRETSLDIAEIAARTGHRSAPHFSQAFRRHWGQSPTDFRRGR